MFRHLVALLLTACSIHAAPSLTNAPSPADGMVLTTAFDDTDIYVNQPVKMTVTWNSTKRFRRCRELQLDLPILHDPAWEVYPIVPDVPEKQRIGLPVNGQRMIAVKSESKVGERLNFAYMLIARRAGSHHSSPARLQCALMQGDRPASPYPSYFDNHFFHAPEADDAFELISLSAPIPAITVHSLPEKDRTPRYSGITGSCTVRSAISPIMTTVGSPMLLTVTVDDISFSGHLNALPDAALDDLGPEFQLTRDPLHVTATKSAKSFTYVLRPLRRCTEAVPALALQIFDPEQKAYRTIRTTPLTITVLPDGEQTVYQPHLAKGAMPPTSLNGIRGNRNESEMLMKTYLWIDYMARYAWALWLLPPLLWLGLRPWLRRMDRCRTDPAYARAIHAARRFRRSCSRDEETAWRAYLADRFDLTAEAVTFEGIADQLADHAVPDDLVQAIRDRFARQDTEHYAPPGTPPTPAPQAATLVRRLEKAARVLLLVACLLPALNGWAQTPEANFDQAMQIRAEKPDEARPLFIEAAFGFEAEGHYFNAGNSWFFADKPGRALAAYRAAQRLRPFNRQLRESIAFIRTQRTDVFNPGASRRSRLGVGWQRFCQWAPALRSSLLTLIYLLGWALFLTARITGKRVPRRIWVVAGVLALTPAISLLQSHFQPDEGVIIESAEARLGPGYAYESAYERILHEATEFQWLQTHNGWVLARLPDGNEAWLRETACVRH